MTEAQAEIIEPKTTKKRQEVATAESTALAPSAGAATPMELIASALASGASIEVLDKLMSLQERWDSTLARKAFDQAFADAKAEIAPIMKNRRVGFDSKKAGAARTDYRHEDLGEIARTIDPVLGKFGLSYRWRTTSVPNEPVSVTCIVSHRDGHSEENTLSAGRDDSGNKNSIQAIGSTITYLQRYTLKAALGLAASNDDDGASAGKEADGPISEAQCEAMQNAIVKTGSDIKAFLRVAGAESVPEILISRFDYCMDLLAKKAKGQGITL